MQTTGIFVHFEGRNSDNEDTGQHSANFFFCAAKFPSMGLGAPLPPAYRLFDCQKSEYAGSINLLMLSNGEPDLDAITAYIRTVFGGPAQAWDASTSRWIAIEPHTKISVGKYALVFPIPLPSIAA